MPRRALTALAAVLVVLPVTVLGAAPDVAAGSPDAATVMAATPPTDPDQAAADNPFVPDDRNLSDCVSAAPQPGCGSEARGGWRQTIVFAVMVAGLAIIGWQITRVVRRARRQLDSSPDTTSATGGHRGP